MWLIKANSGSVSPVIVTICHCKLHSVYVRDNSQNLAPAAGFGVMQYNRVTKICLRPTLVTMVTKTREFLHKISYDSVYVTGIAENPAPNGVFQVVQFNSVIEIYPRLTLVATVTKQLFLDTKLAIARLI